MQTPFSSNFRTALDNGVGKENDQHYIQLDDENDKDEDDEDENDEDEDSEENDEDEDSEEDDDEGEDDENGDIENLFASPEIDGDEIYVTVEVGSESGHFGYPLSHPPKSRITD